MIKVCQLSILERVDFSGKGYFQCLAFPNHSIYLIVNLHKTEVWYFHKGKNLNLSCSNRNPGTVEYDFDSQTNDFKHLSKEMKMKANNEIYGENNLRTCSCLNAGQEFPPGLLNKASVASKIMILAVFLLITWAGTGFSQTPVIESPVDNWMGHPSNDLTYSISHSAGAELQLSFSLKPLPTIPASQSSWSQINVTPKEIIAGGAGSTMTYVKIAVTNQMIGDLRLQVQEKGSGGTVSAPKIIRIYPPNIIGIAKLEAWQDSNIKALTLSGKFLFYYSDQTRSVRCVFRDKQGQTAMTHLINEYPQNTDTINDVFIGIPFHAIPKEGDVRLEIEGTNSNWVSYKLDLPDLTVVSINNTSDLSEGDTSFFSATVENRGKISSADERVLMLKCTPLPTNSIMPSCPPEFGNGLNVDIGPIQPGSTRTLPDYPKIFTWNKGKFLLTALVVPRATNVETSTDNNGKQVVVHVVPKDEDWDHSGELLQIVAPKQGQKEKGNVTLKILKTKEGYGLPIELKWQHDDSQPGEWPNPVDMEVVSQLPPHQYQMNIPFSSFPKIGKWRVYAYIKDPETGGVMVDPSTHQPMQDTIAFTLIGRNNMQFSDTAGKPQIKPAAAVGIKPSLQEKILPLSILSPVENQKINKNQPVTISLKTQNPGEIIWQVEKKEFGRSSFSPQKRNLIRMAATPETATNMRGTLKAAESGYYRFRFKSRKGGGNWSEWRTVMVGSPIMQLSKKQPMQITEKTGATITKSKTDSTQIQKKPAIQQKTLQADEKATTMKSTTPTMKLQKMQLE